jgi:hypothetical protein
MRDSPRNHIILYYCFCLNESMKATDYRELSFVHTADGTHQLFDASRLSVPFPLDQSLCHVGVFFIYPKNVEQYPRARKQELHKNDSKFINSN